MTTAPCPSCGALVFAPTAVAVGDPTQPESCPSQGVVDAPPHIRAVLNVFPPLGGNPVREVRRPSNDVDRFDSLADLE